MTPSILSNETPMDFSPGSMRAAGSAAAQVGSTSSPDGSQNRFRLWRKARSPVCLPYRSVRTARPRKFEYFVSMVSFVTLNPRYVNMADVNFSNKSSSSAEATTAPAAGQSGGRRWDIIELLFFAYRDFVGDADHVLEAFGFGRAHHRVIHFVHRYPGLKVADL